MSAQAATSVIALQTGEPARLPSIAAVDALPVERLPGFLLTLNTLQGRATLRLVATQSPPPPPPSAPYTLAEAARLLPKSSAWLRRKAKEGFVPCAQRVGKSWVFPREAFDRWRQERILG